MSLGCHEAGRVELDRASPVPCVMGCAQIRQLRLIKALGQQLIDRLQSED